MRVAALTSGGMRSAYAREVILQPGRFFSLDRGLIARAGRGQWPYAMIKEFSMLSSVQLALMDAIERRKLLVCVGPLVSTAVGLASPRELVDRCRQRLASMEPNAPTLAIESGVAAYILALTRRFLS